MWHDPSATPRFSEHIELDLSTVVSSIAGPKRPQDRISLTDSKSAFEKILPTYFSEKTGKEAYPVNVGAKATTIKMAMLLLHRLPLVQIHRILQS